MAVGGLTVHKPHMQVILRDPVQRAYSQWNMRRGKRRTRERFARLVERSIADLSRRHPGHPSGWNVVARGLYGVQLERLSSCYARSQIHVASPLLIPYPVRTGRPALAVSFGKKVFLTSLAYTPLSLVQTRCLSASPIG